MKKISSQLPPLDDFREKGLRLPSRKLTSMAEIVPVPSLVDAAVVGLAQLASLHSFRLEAQCQSYGS